ncbi:MAG: hypothetical protein KAH21_11605 [Spirochaetaceae bacterium]|nr:hypothetical protein [Spirochaetaceae bacterium]
MKKIALLLIVTALLSPAIFAAPTDEEVEIAFSGVFAAYGAIFMTSMMGQTIPGASMEMDMETGVSAISFDNLDVETLFSTIGETLDGSGDMPEIAFTHLSGSFVASSEGDMDMDVTLNGGPVNHLEMRIKGEELVLMKANGKNCEYLSEAMDF